MSAEDQPDLNDVFRVAFERHQAEIRTAIVGTVVSFDRNPRQCSVRVDMRAQLRTGEFVAIPQIDAVPVIWPVGGGFAMDADLAIGEQVMLIVIDRDISGWLPAGDLHDPPRLALHNLTNAVAIPGARSINRQGGQRPAAGELYLGADTGQAPWLKLGTKPLATATIEAPTIAIGEGATPLQGAARVGDSVVPDAAWLTWFATVAASLNSLGFPAPLPIPPVGVPFAKITTGSTKTRIQ